METGTVQGSGEVVVYEAPDGEVRVEVLVGGETVWLSQAQMVELFGRDQSVISRHVAGVAFRPYRGHKPASASLSPAAACGGTRPGT